MHRAISFSHLTALEVGPPGLIDFVADAGFTSTGIRLHPAMKDGVAYFMDVGGQRMRETQARMQGRGVRILDIEVFLIGADTDVDAFKPVMEAGAALGATRICVNGEDPQLDRFTANFARLCDLAKPFGMEVDLEFMVWRPVKTIQITTQIVRQANCTNGKVLIDALHLMRSGGTVEDVRAMNPALIGAVQICDGPMLGPDVNDTQAVLQEARGGRLPPLQGEFPLLELVKAVPSTVPISVEVPMGPHAGLEDLAARVALIKQAGARCIDLAS